MRMNSRVVAGMLCAVLAVAPAIVIPEKSDLFETKRFFLVAREGPVRSS